jgi:hypothetical protein
MRPQSIGTETITVGSLVMLWYPSGAPTAPRTPPDQHFTITMVQFGLGVTFH